MGIRDRDYMRKRPDEGPSRRSPADSRLEGFLSGFLARHPRLLLGVGIALAALVIIAVVFAAIGGGG